jgi:hypothetical protein
MASKEAMEQAAHNRATVGVFMRSYPGITQREIAGYTRLSLMCVNRHYNAIRNQWRQSRRADAVKALLDMSSTTATSEE